MTGVLLGLIWGAVAILGVITLNRDYDAVTAAMQAGQSEAALKVLWGLVGLASMGLILLLMVIGLFRRRATLWSLIGGFAPGLGLAGVFGA